MSEQTENEKIANKLIDDCLTSNYAWSSEESIAKIVKALDAKDASPAALRKERDILKDLLMWTRQTIHQAYHEGFAESCEKVVCSAITEKISVPKKGDE